MPAVPASISTCVIAVASLVSSLALLATQTRAQAPSPALQKLLEAAKKEGQARIFVGSPKFAQSKADELSKAFQAKFGFPLRITLASLGPHPPVIQKIIAEARSGIKPPVDVFPSGENGLELLRQAGLVDAELDWSALGVDAKLISERRDGVLVHTNPRNVFYNTSLVGKEEAPRRYEDLLDARWKGRIVGPAFGQGFSQLALLMGEQAAYDYTTRLVQEQKLVLVRTFSDIATRVVNGEFAIGFGINANISGHLDKGGPLANAPLERTTGSSNYALVPKGAEFANGGRALIWFMCCTPEGRTAANTAIGFSTFDTPGTEKFAIGGNGRGVHPSYEWAIKDEPRISKQMEKILGL